MEKNAYCDKCGRVSLWKPTKINGRWVMSRLYGNTVQGRRMNWIERILYFYLKDDVSVKR